MLKQKILLASALIIGSIVIAGCSNSTKPLAPGGEVINGHTLPPEPDPDINNATLAGIDVNNNGVRDDVERKIYLEHDLEIERQYLMMAARQQQKRLEADDLIENAKKWEKLDKPDLGCVSYLYDTYGLDFFGTVKYIENAVYNTRPRISKYMKYNQALSGGVYSAPNSFDVESSCDFNVTRAITIDDAND